MSWCQSCGEQYAGAEHNCGWTRISNDELRHLKARAANGMDSGAVLALMKAAAEVRDGAWINGAPSHIFAELVKALEADGWVLTRTAQL